MTRLYLLFCVLVTAMLTACYSTKSYYSNDVKNWATDAPVDPKVGVSHEVYFAGGLGHEKKTNSIAWKVLQQKVAASGKNATLLLLGDNLPNDKNPTDLRKWAEDHYASLEDLKGKKYFLSGPNEWSVGDQKFRGAADRAEDLIEDMLGKGTYKPGKGGCGDPKAIEVGDDLAIIFIDSEWWLVTDREDQSVSDGCKVKNFQDLKARFEELIDDYDDRKIIVAMHHPIYSKGESGGYFSLKNHLFPLTRVNPSLYVPLPVIGSIYPTSRYLGSDKEDLTNGLNQELMNMLLNATIETKNIIFVSGHEPTLQYFEDNDRHYAVSGALTGRMALKSGQDGNFLYGRNGYGKIIYYENGAAYLEMWAADEKNPEGTLLFRHQISAERLVPNPADFDFQDPMPSTFKSVADDRYEAGKGKRKWMGDLYRDEWGVELELPVLNLDTMLGGLKPIKKGGGKQTSSLRLEAGNGKQYVMRSVAKDVSPLVPDWLKNTVGQKIFQDFTSTAHPYGAWPIPPLAKAAGVYHTSPTFYYVPKQPALGEYLNDFGDEIYLFEERPAKDRSDEANFGFAKKIVSFRAMNRKLWEDHDHRVDQKQALRSRVFDMLVGDWDKRDDNWRHARFEIDKDHTVYKAVPRDRDQAFVKVDGRILWLASRPWAVRNFQNYDTDVRDIIGLCFNPRFFDRAYLTEMTRKDWVEMAAEIEKSATDEVITKAFNRWPQELNELNGNSIKEKMKVRRTKLGEFASRYYDVLAKEVDVVGSDKRELFEITRMNKEEMRVQMFKLSKSGKKKDKLYDRTFLASETKEVRLFGLKGNDEFKISGEASKGSLLRVISGPGKDVLTDESKVGGGKRTIVYDDSREENQINPGKETKLRLSTDPDVHTYDWRSFKYGTYLPLITPGFNVDDGIILGGGVTWTRYGFRKQPYKSLQAITAQVAVATGAAKVSYTGNFIDVFGKADFYLESSIFSPIFVTNFFGLGNDTPYPVISDEDLNFNRLRYGSVHVFPALSFISKNTRHQLLIGPEYTLTDAERTEGRFAATDESGLVDDDFELKHYGGLRIGYRINAVDNPMLPLRGIKLTVDVGGQGQIDEWDGNNFRYARGDFSFYLTGHRGDNFISFAGRVGGGANFGNYEFFQAQTLGRGDNLRGFRRQRFAGDASFYTNTDVRIRFAKVDNNIMPFGLGVHGFFDNGRVWFDGEDSNTWHQGYGGGIFVMPYDLVAVTLTYGQSVERSFIEVILGFEF